MINSYHEKIRDASNERPASAIEAEKRTANQSPSLVDLNERIQLAEQITRDQANFLGFANDYVPVDDQQPPLAPVGLTHAVFPHEVSIGWTVPPTEDFVVSSTITATPSAGNGSAVTFKGGPDEGGATNLKGGVQYTFTVVLVDRWNRVSPPSAGFTATPLRTAAEEVDLDALALGNRITGLLPNANLAQITDPGKLAEGAVKTIAQAANQNRLPFTESRPDQWEIGAWATVGPGRHVYGGAGASMSVVSHGSPAKKWWRLSTNTTDVWGYPFDNTDYGQIVGEWYIISASAYNPTASTQTAYIGMEHYNAAGTSLGYTSGSLSVAPGATVRPFLKYQVPVNTVSSRWWIENGAGTGVQVDYADVMLEHVLSTATAPSAYAVPSLFSGAIGANLIAGLDILGVRAIFDTASIESGKFKSLAADKITGGIITAAEIHLSTTGKIMAGASTVLDSDGLTFNPGNTWITTDMTKDKRVGPVGDWAALAFYDSTSQAEISRGVVIRADGIPGAFNAGGKEGCVRIISTLDGDVTDPAHGRIDVQSDRTVGAGFVRIKARTNVEGKFTVASGGAQINNDLLVSGAVDVRSSFRNTAQSYELNIGQYVDQPFNHGFASSPRHVFAQYWQSGTSKWLPVTRAVEGHYVSVNSTQVFVYNGGAGTLLFRVTIIH